MTAGDEEPYVKHAVEYLKKKYGDVEVEVEEVFKYAAGIIEVSGTLRRRGEKTRRRFTVKLESNSMRVLGFGLR